MCSYTFTENGRIYPRMLQETQKHSERVLLELTLLTTFQRVTMSHVHSPRTAWRDIKSGRSDLRMWTRLTRCLREPNGVFAMA